MSKSSDLVARLIRQAAASPVPPAPEPVEAVPALAGGQRGRPARTVRFSVDLEVDLHRSLRLFALEQRTDATGVVRALLELLDDPMISQAVLDRLRSEST